MKVYILIKHYHYETKNILEIFDDLNKAKFALKSISDNSDELFKLGEDGLSAEFKYSESLYIEEWEVS